MKCPDCFVDGEGDRMWCNTCKGTGEVPEYELYYTDFQKAMMNSGTPSKDCPPQIREKGTGNVPTMIDCPTCKGTSNYINNYCPTCDCKGKVEEKE